LIDGASGQRNAVPSDRRIDKEARARLEALPSVDITTIDKTGAPTGLDVPKGVRKLKQRGEAATEADIRDTGDLLLRALGYEPTDISLRRKWVDDLGHVHAIFDQTLAGLPVVGGELRVHFDRDGDLQAVTGPMRKAAHRRLSRKAAIFGPAAEIRAAEGTQAQGKRIGGRRLVFLRSTKTDEFMLAWEVRVAGDTREQPVLDLVYIDASSGEEIERHALIHSARNRQIFDADQKYAWGTLRRSEGQGNASDSDVNVNYQYIGDAYNYFWVVHARDSHTGYGTALRSTVDYGSRYNNAFWHPTEERWGFGDGDGTLFGHFTLSRDVVAHEFTHGLIQNTSNLAYANEPGAINEALADIFGALCDAWARGNGAVVIDASTWKVGEDVFTPGTPGDALRYMDNPTQDGVSYDWYPSRYIGGNDYGGVHWNSGIANLAFKLAVTGGRHPRWAAVGQPLNVPALGAEAAQLIFYRANYPYLSSSSGFKDLRAATARAARDLADAGQVPSNAAQIMHLVWDAVGVDYLSGNARPMNISTRCDVGTGNGIAIAGFVVSGGASSQDMLVRGVGPTLGQFGVPNVIADPQLSLFTGGALTASNDNWYQASNAAQIAQKGLDLRAFALPNPSLDAALLQPFAAGTYTVHLAGTGGGTGNGMVELYATDSNNPNHLVNLSTRCLVTSNPAIAGFVIDGTASKRLLIRAVGPRLANFGLSGAIANPKLSLFVGGTVIRENDAWGMEANAAEIVTTAQAVGAFSLLTGSEDAAMLVSLPPGIYTAHMSGVGGSTGIGMIEIYEVN